MKQKNYKYNKWYIENQNYLPVFFRYPTYSEDEGDILPIVKLSESDHHNSKMFAIYHNDTIISKTIDRNEEKWIYKTTFWGSYDHG